MYIPTRLQNELSLPTVKMYKLQIKTVRNSECGGTSYDVVRIDIESKDEMQTMDTLVVPLLCNPPTTQSIDHSSGKHDHLICLELADFGHMHSITLTQYYKDSHDKCAL